MSQPCWKSLSGPAISSDGAPSELEQGCASPPTVPCHPSRIHLENEMTANLKKLVDDDPVLAWLESRGLIGGYVSPGGWVDIFCPWHDRHSNPDEPFAGYWPILPEPYPTRRAFHCFHTSCRDRTIRDFLDFVADSGGPQAEEFGSSSLATELQKLAQDPNGPFSRGFFGPWRGGAR